MPFLRMISFSGLATSSDWEDDHSVAWKIRPEVRAAALPQGSFCSCSSWDGMPFGAPSNSQVSVLLPALLKTIRG